MKNSEPDSLADDLLVGADSIAAFLFDDRKKRRRVYQLAEAGARNKFPCFRLGGIVCARRSTLVAWIESQEKAE